MSIDDRIWAFSFGLMSPFDLVLTVIEAMPFELVGVEVVMPLFNGLAEIQNRKKTFKIDLSKSNASNMIIFSNYFNKFRVSNYLKSIKKQAQFMYIYIIYKKELFLLIRGASPTKLHFCST